MSDNLTAPTPAENNLFNENVVLKPVAYAGDVKSSQADTDPSGNNLSIEISLQYGLSRPMENPEDGTQGYAVPPDRTDLNTLLNFLSGALVYLQRNGNLPFSQNVATYIAGYDKGSILSYQKGNAGTGNGKKGLVYSLNNGNTNSPDGYSATDLATKGWSEVGADYIGGTATSDSPPAEQGAYIYKTGVKYPPNSIISYIKGSGGAGLCYNSLTTTNTANPNNQVLPYNGWIDVLNNTTTSVDNGEDISNQLTNYNLYGLGFGAGSNGNNTFETTSVFGRISYSQDANNSYISITSNYNYSGNGASDGYAINIYNASTPFIIGINGFRLADILFPTGATSINIFSGDAQIIHGQLGISRNANQSGFYLFINTGISAGYGTYLNKRFAQPKNIQNITYNTNLYRKVRQNSLTMFGANYKLLRIVQVYNKTITPLSINNVAYDFICQTLTGTNNSTTAIFHISKTDIDNNNFGATTLIAGQTAISYSDGFIGAGTVVPYFVTAYPLLFSDTPAVNPIVG